MFEDQKGKILDNAKAMAGILIEEVKNHQFIEKQYVVFMNGIGKVLSIEVMSVGTINAVNIFPREIIKRSFELEAVQIAVAHNHPSEEATPTEVDIKQTTKLFTACAAVDMLLQDSLILTMTEFFSFNDAGVMEKIAKNVNEFF